MSSASRSGRIAAAGIALFSFLCASSVFGQATQPAGQKSFIDYFLPTPITGTLAKDVWGAPEVGPRDPRNGLEDPAVKQWCYWDGQIIKAPDGKYHMFASRWDQAGGHMAWGTSKAVHAVSDSLFGPYVDKGLTWPTNQGGKGHNVTALTLPDGRYAVIVSTTRPGDVFVSKSLDGPWEQLGTIKVDQQGWKATNVCILIRPDGDYEMIRSSGSLYIAKASDGILGPYKPVTQGSVYPRNLRTLEDPVLWYSGGLYHIIMNSYSTHVAYHLTSADGIHDWVNRGVAYAPAKDFLRYTDGTINHWALMERPGVYLENGHVVALTLACLDVAKRQELGNDTHGSKVVVVPFDGEAFDRDMARIVAAEAAAPTTRPAQ